MISRCLSFIPVFLASLLAAGEAIDKPQGVARDLQVCVTTAVREGRVELTFDRAGEFTVWRKLANAPQWGEPLAKVTGTTWADVQPPRGQLLEYRVRTAVAKNEIYGYCASGVDIDRTGWKGKVILLMADDIQTPLAAEIERLKQDLTGDGWTPVPLIVPAAKGWSDAKQAPGIRAQIKALYERDPEQTTLLFILGHVPVPRSGSAAELPYPPDGHCDRRGAHSADCYYAELSGEWTDTATITEFSDKRWKTPHEGKLSENFRNVPGDGKFDQEYLPQDVVLGYGRVDMRDLSAGAELELLRRYLDKNHAFRHAALDPKFASAAERRCMIRDGMLSCGSHAWASFPALVGWKNIEFLTPNELPKAADADEGHAAEHGPYLFYARGNGVPPRGDGGKAAFWLGFQSGVPYWGEPGNSMREALAGANYTLGYICTPYAIRYPLHRLALGLPLGDVIKEGINNAHELTDPGTGYHATPSWGEIYQGQMRRMLFNLVGDPTLSLYHFAPATGVRVTRTGKNATVRWTASPDPAVTGYDVWRAEAIDGAWTKLTAAPINAAQLETEAGGAWYMVRAIRTETTGSGQFLNAAQGAFGKEERN